MLVPGARGFKFSNFISRSDLILFCRSLIASTLISVHCSKRCVNYTAKTPSCKVDDVMLAKGGPGEPRVKFCGSSTIMCLLPSNHRKKYCAGGKIKHVCVSWSHDSLAGAGKYHGAPATWKVLISWSQIGNPWASGCIFWWCQRSCTHIRRQQQRQVSQRQVGEACLRQQIPRQLCKRRPKPWCTALLLVKLRYCNKSRPLKNSELHLMCDCPAAHKIWRRVDSNQQLDVLLLGTPWLAFYLTSLFIGFKIKLIAHLSKLLNPMLWVIKIG